MKLLAEFDSVLVGTIPIDLAIEGSDLDIICHWDDPELFKVLLQKHFGGFPAFKITKKEISSISSVIARFRVDRFIVEVFGQNIPSMQQNGYRHMIIEHRILKEKGEIFRSQIQSLKKEGPKTEQAFCRLLGIKGNPFEELLKL